LENENSDQLSYAYAKFYNPSEHLALDEVIVLFKGRVIFKQYNAKKHKHISMKIYKFCDMTVYTHNVTVYLGRDRQNATQLMITTHAIVRSLTRRVEGLDHGLHMDCFSCPDSFDDLRTRGIN
jgi:hypothetical protein